MFKQLFVLATLLFTSTQALAQCPGCTSSYYGQSCGPQLTVELTTRNPSAASFGVYLTEAVPSDIGILIVGTQQLDLPIPGTLCHVYTDFVYGHFVQIRNDGTFDWVHPWPNGNPGVVFVQIAQIDRRTFVDITTTRGARAERTN
jgi:hypothetical protein